MYLVVALLVIGIVIPVCGIFTGSIFSPHFVIPSLAFLIAGVDVHAFAVSDTFALFLKSADGITD